MSMLALFPLLSKKLNELTVDELNLVSKQLNINVEVTETMREAALTLMQSGNLDSVADLIKSPEQIKQLVSFFQSQKKVDETRTLKQCPHCDNFHLV